MRGARTTERNKSRDEVRTLIARTVTPEQVSFVAAAQAALLHRQTTGRQPETVYLLTSRAADRLDADRWLARQRRAWDIENGPHQRLGASADEDRSRVRQRQAVHVLALFRRVSVSVFKEWQTREPRRARATLRDFHDAMRLRAQRGGFALVAAARPSLCNSS